MADLGKAYVQIIPSAEGIAGKIQKAIGSAADEAGDKAGESSGESFGKKFASAAKTIIAAAGIGKFISAALDEGGKLQQSYIGGLETLYGDAAGAAREYAMAAAEAGISANDYAEQAVSFGAALKGAFGGDVTKAAEAANTAIMDMADNSAKMGTDIGSVQAAYQGFAKQNYTMLDNLKLGYGGTKTEMERLLADAEKLSGVHYDIENLGDVYDAIHVIQDDLGLTGVAAEEAASTLTGSFGAVQASFQNLIGQMALGESISAPLQTLTESVVNWLVGNLLPMVGSILSQVPTLIVGAVQGISAHADELIFTGVEMVTNFISGVITSIPELIEAAGTLVHSVISTITSIDWLGIGSDLLASIDEGILSQIPVLLESTATLVDDMSGYLMEHLPDFLEKGIDIISSLVAGLFEKAPDIIDSLGKIVSSLIGLLLQNLPSFWQKGGEFIFKMIEGISGSLPDIIKSIFGVVTQLIATLAQNLPMFLQKGIEAVAQLAVGLVRAIPKVVSAVPQVINSAVKLFKSFDWWSIGKNIINGIVNGIKNAGHLIADTLSGLAKNAWNGLKSFFGIASPSKLMRDTIGRYIPEGMAVGIEENADYVSSAMEDLAKSALDIPIDQNMEISPVSTISPVSAGSTTNMGGVTINIAASDFNNAREIAEAVKNILTSDLIREEAVFA